MAELTPHQIERRAATAMANPVPVNIAALPGLFFRPLTLGQKGKSNLTYSRALMEYQAAGLPSEFFLRDQLKRAVEASGLTLGVLTRKAALYEKQMRAMPEELIGPYDQLTDAEVAELPPDVRQTRAQAIEARGRRIVEALAQALDEQERETLRQIAEIEALEQHLRQQTAEYAARRDQMIGDLLMGAIREDGSPYFASTEELEAIDPPQALVDLMVAWQQFTQGMPSDFFSRS